MFRDEKKRKSDEIIYSESPDTHIPIAIHFADDCLLTKNGELIKIIKVCGINSENISPQLSQLKKVLNQVLIDNIQDSDYSVWLHTIRSKTNIDDPAPYSNFLSSSIHELWAEKNFWRDKYYNTLYISILFKRSIIKIKNLNSLALSLFPKVISKFQAEYLDNALVKLSTTVDKILEDLKKYDVKKLSIIYENEACYSELLELYNYIANLNYDKPTVPIADLSLSLGKNLYAVHVNQIDIINKKDEKKSIAILSLKEYQSNSTMALDNFLQLPLEIIATEIFFLVNKQMVVPIFAEQEKFLGVTNDQIIAKANGIEEILKNDPNIQYCYQQLMIGIISDSDEKLEEDIRQASISLGQIGIMHIREDMHLEKAFWAQLPGNFSYLHRALPTITKYTGIFGGLHSFAIGNKYNKWGKAITLLRTESGTPFYMNFHVGQRGNTGIIGSVKNGKTLLTNFLISETMKFNPSLLYFSDNHDSHIFVEGLGGRYDEVEESIINPLLVEKSERSRNFLESFFKIILNHYVNPLKPRELEIISKVIDYIFTLNMEERSLAKISEDDKLFNEGGGNIKKLLSIFNYDAKYNKLFEGTKNICTPGYIQGINLYKFTNQYFTSNNLPDDKRFMEKFYNDLNSNNNMRSAIIFAFSYLHNNIDNKPKIIAFDNMLMLLDIGIFQEIIYQMFQDAVNSNGIIVCNLELKKLIELEENEILAWMNIFDSTIMLPLEVKIRNLAKKLNLSTKEIEKLNNIKTASRCFVLKQNDNVNILELSIGGFIGITKILSAKSGDVNIYKKLLESTNGEPKEWLPQLNQAFEEQ